MASFTARSLLLRLSSAQHVAALHYSHWCMTSCMGNRPASTSLIMREWRESASLARANVCSSAPAYIHSAPSSIHSSHQTKCLVLSRQAMPCVQAGCVFGALHGPRHPTEMAAGMLQQKMCLTTNQVLAVYIGISEHFSVARSIHSATEKASSNISQSPFLPSQLLSGARKAGKSRKVKYRALQGNPCKRGICLRVYTTAPKKPNSANRKVH